MTARRKVTMRDVARRAGCSRAAVSHVLTGSGNGVIGVGKETAERIRHAARELNFYPNHAARQLAGKRSELLGVIASNWASATGLRIFAWLERAAAERGYQVLASQTEDNPQRLDRAAAACLSRDVEGIIYVGYGSEAQWDDAGRALTGIPHIVAIFGTPDIPGAAYVDVDAAEGARLGVAHLLERGRKRIGILLEDLDRPENRRRHRAFLDIHRESGLPTNEDRMVVGTKDWWYDRPEIGEQIDGALDRLIDHGRADALLADDDYCAALLIRRLSCRGLRVPEDVAVVGYGNQIISHFLNPKLTTIDIRVREVVLAAVEMLTEAIRAHGDRPMRSVTLQPELLVRDST